LLIVADDILSQEEVDALLRGVSGEADERAPAADAGGVRPYDIGRQERIVRGRMPTLELINERFARLLRVGLYNFMRKSAVTDDFTWLKGGHTITFGTHNEFFKFENVFVQNFWGQYRFSSIDNFAAGVAGGFNHNFSNTADPYEPARFSVRQLGVYFGDQWRARST